MITEQRLGLAQLLEGLSEAEWEQPSLCAGWRVRDVAATCTAPPGLGSMLADGIRARRFHRLNHDVAVRHAARPTGRSLRAVFAADSRRLPVVTNYRNILRRPRPRAGHRDPAGPESSDAASSVVGRRRPRGPWGWPFWARHRLRGVRLLATDTDWSAGKVELRGPIMMLLLLLTGRTMTALPHLSGPGVHTITERLPLRVLSPEDGTKDAFQPDQADQPDQ